MTDAKNGDFCYNLDGSRGSIDAKISEVPVNVECDARLSCLNSVQGAQCNQNESMRSIQVTFLLIISIINKNLYGLLKRMKIVTS